SVIVKEKKRQDWIRGAPSDVIHSRDGVGGMIKRAPGYDPEHGDWEYFYFENASRIESGRIVTCVQCHVGASGKDYVFGEWSSRASSGASGGAIRSVGR